MPTHPLRGLLESREGAKSEVRRFTQMATG